MADDKQSQKPNGYQNEFWALADKLVFAVDFVSPQLFEPQDGDEISFDFGGGIRKVALSKITHHKTIDGRVFIRFFTD